MAPMQLSACMEKGTKHSATQKLGAGRMEERESARERKIGRDRQRE